MCFVLVPGPELAPMAKFRSRLTVQLPIVCERDICQADLISPIGRINLSPFTGPKVSVQSVWFLKFMFCLIIIFDDPVLFLIFVGCQQFNWDMSTEWCFW